MGAENLGDRWVLYSEVQNITYSSLAILRHILQVAVMWLTYFPRTSSIFKNYRIISQRCSEDGLRSHQDPQSMGSPPNVPTRNSPVWMRQQRRKGAFQKLLYIAIVFLTVYVFMAISLGNPVCILLLTKYKLVIKEHTANNKTLSSTNHGENSSLLPIHLTNMWRLHGQIFQMEVAPLSANTQHFGRRTVSFPSQ